MVIREVQEEKFENITDYNTWISTKYCFDDGIRVCGLNILDNGQVVAKYIKLF
jgi:hypothetical protein